MKDTDSGEILKDVNAHTCNATTRSETESQGEACAQVSGFVQSDTVTNSGTFTCLCDAPVHTHYGLGSHKALLKGAT